MPAEKTKKEEKKHGNALISKTADPIFERLRLLSFAMLCRCSMMNDE
jgi:hypothetical protein